MMDAGPPSPEDDASRPADTAAPPHAPGRARRLLVALAVAAAVIAADQGTKQWALSYLAHRSAIALPGNWISLRLITNPGAAFSVGSGSTWIFTVFATAVVVVVPWFAARARGQAMALGLLVGGAAGNLTDRLFRAPGPGTGRVVDFIDYHSWFIGNVADIAIVVSAGLLLLQALRSPGRKQPVPAQPPQACPDP
jgi:signal peptidase II